LENGESGLTVQNRARQFLQVIPEKLGDIEENISNVLIVSHGGLIRRMFSIMFHEMECKLPPKLCELPNFAGASKAINLKNTCISRFEIEINNENCVIETMKCLELMNSAHLDNLM